MASKLLGKATALAGGLSRPGVPSFLATNSTILAFAAQARNLASQAQPALLWAVPGAVFAGWMVLPALTDPFRTSLGLPLKKEAIPSQVKYQADEIDNMPTVRK